MLGINHHLILNKAFVEQLSSTFFLLSFNFLFAVCDELFMLVYALVLAFNNRDKSQSEHSALLVIAVTM